VYASRRNSFALENRQRHPALHVLFGCSVKASVFLMAVTGGIASYAVSNTASPVSSLALGFPAGFAYLFFRSIVQAKRIAQVHTEACKALGVQEFNFEPLEAVCKIFSSMCAVATVGLLLLMAFQIRGGFSS
jgi:uncharacterized membrane protein